MNPEFPSYLRDEFADEEVPVFVARRHWWHLLRTLLMNPLLYLWIILWLKFLIIGKVSWQDVLALLMLVGVGVVSSVVVAWIWSRRCYIVTDRRVLSGGGVIPQWAAIDKVNHENIQDTDSWAESNWWFRIGALFGMRHIKLQTGHGELLILYGSSALERAIAHYDDLLEALETEEDEPGDEPGEEEAAASTAHLPPPIR